MPRQTWLDEPLPIDSRPGVVTLTKAVGRMVSRKRRAVESLLAKRASSLSGLEIF